MWRGSGFLRLPMSAWCLMTRETGMLHLKAPEPTAGAMGECDDHAIDQHGPSLQAYLFLTAGMKVGESTESVQGGKRVCMHRCPW